MGVEFMTTWIWQIYLELYLTLQQRDLFNSSTGLDEKNNEQLELQDFGEVC